MAPCRRLSGPERLPVNRVGFGYDVHRSGGRGPLMLCGVQLAPSGGLIGTSDGDVAIHALIDAILGAAALGDIGMLFPSDDPQWADAPSLNLLEIALSKLGRTGMAVEWVDVTIIAEDVPIAPHREEMRSVLSGSLGLDIGRVSVKATTTDGIGAVGRGEGVAAVAVAGVHA